MDSPETVQFLWISKKGDSCLTFWWVSWQQGASAAKRRRETITDTDTAASLSNSNTFHVFFHTNNEARRDATPTGINFPCSDYGIKLLVIGFSKQCIGDTTELNRDVLSVLFYYIRALIIDKYILSPIVVNNSNEIQINIIPQQIKYNNIKCDSIINVIAKFGIPKSNQIKIEIYLSLKKKSNIC